MAVTLSLNSVFGRVGAKGQRLVKSFDSNERAKAEAEKLTAEKTRKGDRPIG